MQLCLTLEHRFFQTPDGKTWTITQCPYDFYREYLEVFDSVRVISRAFSVPRAEENFLPVEGPGVEFYAMPGYKGPIGFLRKRSEVSRRAAEAVPPQSAALFRLPSQIGNSVEAWLHRRGLPYAVEVVADPWDVFSPAANQHPVAPVARHYYTRKLKQQCRRAVAVSYVTQSYLQKRYPPRSLDPAHERDFAARENTQFSMAVSDVNLSQEAFVSNPRLGLHDPSCMKIVYVGTLESLYKGPDVLLDAISISKKQGVAVKLRLLGIGSQIPSLRDRCVRLGIAEDVCFAGSVTTGEPVRRELDQADLFILPSRAEGVPRAMLEAMARALPCIGSVVGGIPELLHQEDLVPIGDSTALANTITQVARDPARYARMSARNLERAASYATARLAKHRLKFYRAVRELTRTAYTSGAPEILQPVPGSPTSV
jgi:glycosyltransferase involved in cell wall biosynthesis